jgi:hypothetical protein
MNFWSYEDKPLITKDDKHEHMFPTIFCLCVLNILNFYNGTDIHVNTKHADTIDPASKFVFIKETVVNEARN